MSDVIPKEGCTTLPEAVKRVAAGLADRHVFLNKNWRTGACAQARNLPTGSYQKSVHTEGQRQTQAAGHLDLARSSLHDSSNAGAGTDL